MPSDRVKKFYELDSYAIVGVSQTSPNIGRSVYEELAARRKRVYAVGRQAGNFGGIEFYESLKALPEKPQAIIVATKPADSAAVLDEVATNGAEYIWLSQGSYDKDVLALVERLGIDPIKGCPLMYIPGVQVIHRIHRVFAEIFGGGYK